MIYEQLVYDILKKLDLDIGLDANKYTVSVLSDMIKNYMDTINSMELSEDDIIPHKFPNGMTVKELKKIIKNWSDIDEYTGVECEIWLTTGMNLSSPVTGIMPLNKRKYNNKVCADLLFETK